MPDDPRELVACPRCTAQVKIHPSTKRIPLHRERNEKKAPKCGFGGDYLPGFTPETPIRDRSRRNMVAVA